MMHYMRFGAWLLRLRSQEQPPGDAQRPALASKVRDIDGTATFGGRCAFSKTSNTHAATRHSVTDR